MISGPPKLVLRASYILEELFGISSEDIDLTIEYWNEDYGEFRDPPDQKYIIYIPRNSKYTTATLGHELVHLKQHHTGQLKLVELPEGCYYIWKGEPIAYSGNMEDYLLYPWELEARALEAWIKYRWDNRSELYRTRK